MEESCGEMDYNLDGEAGDKRVENVPTFRYLGRHLDQTYDDWPAVRGNIMNKSSVWGRIGTLLQWEGEDPKVSASFYREVVQAILLYGSEMWDISATMAERIERTHT